MNFIQILVSILAAVLSWQCNKNQPIFLRIVYALIAAIFGWVYLIYYAFVHVNIKRSDGISKPLFDVWPCD